MRFNSSQVVEEGASLAMDFTNEAETVGENKSWTMSTSKTLADKKKLRIASCGGIFCTILLIAVTPHYINLSRKEAKQPIGIMPAQRYTTDLKYILFWGKMPLIEEGQSMFVKQNCKYQNCFITYNQSLLNEDMRNFNAIVFNIMNVIKDQINTSIPRSPHQVYIFRSLEPATKRPVCDPKFDSFFNWTWTYKLDSDIPHPFFNIYNKDRTELLGPKADMQWPNYDADRLRGPTPLNIGGKKKAVAWIIFNCMADERDFEYFAMLQKELDKLNLKTQIFGQCAESCPKNQLKECYKLIEDNYYFNYVVEDYNGIDYVGDRLLKSLQYATIPIVRGVSNYSRFLPPRSFLGATQPAKLAATMSHLIRHPREYIRFFDWSNYYSYSETRRNDVCELCTKLNEKTGHVTQSNLRSWWSPKYEDKCTL